MPKIAKCSSNKISPIYCGSNNGISAVLENRVKNFFASLPPPMQPPRRGRQPPAPCVRQHVRLRLRGRDVSDPGRGGDGRGGHEGLHRARPEEDGGGDTGGARRFDTDTGVLPSPQVTMLGFSFRIQRLLLPPAAKGLRGNRVRAKTKDHVRIIDGNIVKQQDLKGNLVSAQPGLRPAILLQRGRRRRPRIRR